jgi:hypothetical protein
MKRQTGGSSLIRQPLIVERGWAECFKDPLILGVPEAQKAPWAGIIDQG